MFSIPQAAPNFLHCFHPDRRARLARHWRGDRHVNAAPANGATFPLPASPSPSPSAAAAMMPVRKTEQASATGAAAAAAAAGESGETPIDATCPGGCPAGEMPARDHYFLRNLSP